MKYIGWVLFCFGLLIHILFWAGDLRQTGNEKFEKNKWNYQILSIITIGVGGYLIKNFTEKK